MTPLTAADDGFHPIAREDDSWTETCWFAAGVPERGLGVWTYPLFRPRLGIMSCGIYVWEQGAEELWQLPYYRTYRHLPFPQGQQLTELSLSNGLSYRCLEPLTCYHVAYEDGDSLLRRSSDAGAEIGIFDEDFRRLPLVRWKLPRYVLLQEVPLPRLANGKIDRPALVESFDVAAAWDAAGSSGGVTTDR